MTTTHTKIIVGIIGGIGSGKSIVSRIVKSMGYRVYDSDTEAKRIMRSSGEIHSCLKETFGDNIICEGEINRKLLGEIVFNNPEKLESLNRIVHKHVLLDFDKWIADHDDSVLFIETALLYQSGLDGKVNLVWDVEADASVRIRRVKKRNNLTEAEVKSRIESQNFIPTKLHPKIFRITNDDVQPILPQILIGLDSIGSMVLR